MEYQTQEQGPLPVLSHVDFPSPVYVVGILILLFPDEELRLRKLKQLAKLWCMARSGFKPNSP